MKLTHRASLAPLALAGLVVAGSGQTTASIFLKEDMRSLKKSSEAVVHAKVADLYSYWNTDGSIIFTDVTLEVKRNLHGVSDRQIVVRVPGGTVGGFTSEMIGAPKFELDEEVVVFISRWLDGVPMVNGYFQGKSRVVPDQANNLVLHGGVADGIPMPDLARQLRQAN